MTVTVLLAGCGGGSNGSGDAVGSGGTAGGAPGACMDAMVAGRNIEAANKAIPVAYLQSVRNCTTLAEWTAAAHSVGVDLGGREAQFVENVCTASADDVRALPICQEAEAAAKAARSTP
jgi:hypothetical protein